MNSNVIKLKKIFNSYLNEYLNDNFNIHTWNNISIDIINSLEFNVNNNLIHKKHLKIINNKSFDYINEFNKNKIINNVLEIKLEYIKYELIHNYYYNYNNTFSEYELKLINILFFIFEKFEIIKKNKDIFAIVNFWIKYLFTIKNKTFSYIIYTLMYLYYNELIENYHNDIIYIENDTIYIKNNNKIIQNIKNKFKYVEIKNYDMLITDYKKYILFNNNTITKTVGY